jgi:hypothetical protein
MFDLRLLAGTLVTFFAVILIGMQLIGGNAEVAALARGEAPRIELSVMEKPLPGQQHIKVPVWRGTPAEIAVHLIPFLDTENDTKMEVAAMPVRAALPIPAPKAVPPMVAIADVEADTKTDPIFVAAVTAPPPAAVKIEPVKLEAAKPSAPAMEPPAMLARLNEADLEPTGSISLPESIEAPQPRIAPEPARPVVRQPVVQRQAAHPAPAPATPQPLSPQPYSHQLPQQPQQTQPNPLAVLFPPFPPAQARPVTNAAQPQPQPPFANPAPAQPVKYPPFDRTAIGVLNPCCSPRNVIGGGE